MDIERFEEVKTTGGKMINKGKKHRKTSSYYMETFLAGKNEEGKMANICYKTEVFTFFNTDRIANAITHFAFRNGPLEDMHANNQLSEEDMKLLNKTMHNRLAYIFMLIAEDRWIEFDYVIADFMNNDSQWDKAEPDNQGYTKRCIMEYTEAINTPERK